MSHENFHILCVIEWQRPPLSFQTCNTWSSHLQKSSSILWCEEPGVFMHFVIWQVVAATESTGAQWGTEHPTHPPITHPPPFYPPPYFPAYHSPRQRSISSNCLTLSSLQILGLFLVIIHKISINTIYKAFFCHPTSLAKYSHVFFLLKCTVF